MRASAFLLFTALFPGLVAPALAGEPSRQQRLAEIDRLWAERSCDFDGRSAGAEPIGEIVEVLTEWVAAEPDDLVLINRLLQALDFEIQYVADEAAAKMEVSERAVEVVSAIMTTIHGSPDLGDSNPEELAEQAAAWDGSGELHFWAAVHWGFFGENQGAMKALRRGVAKKIKTHAETAILLAPEVQRGGPYRILGRMHAVAPKVPLVTGWIKRKEAVVLLQAAYDADPSDRMNQQFLYEIWIEEVPERRDQALDGLRELAEATARPEFLAEDTQVARQVAETLDKR